MPSILDRVAEELTLLRRESVGLRQLPAGMSLQQPQILLATWFGSGLLRPMSGTWGSIAAVPVGYAIAMLGGYLALSVAVLLCFLIGVKVSDTYCRRSGEHDASAIVIDEVAGMWLAAIPAGLDPLAWLVAFILFRLFDIKKPWPASYFENRRKGGIDVMMDDIFAGFYACLCTLIFCLYIQGTG